MSLYQVEAAQRRMIDRVLAEIGDCRPVLWYYTPTALGFTDHVRPSAIVYDCMNEFPTLAQRERSLLERADLVFTDGHSLYLHKRRAVRHRNIYPFASCVDLAHFERAREIDTDDPPDQAEIEHPRVGFFGVIDEQIDLRLLGQLAETRPDLQFVMIGPIVLTDLAALPQHPNVHWLGAKAHDELPAYVAGWDASILPFARNDATIFASRTKAPECLAAGKPVVSTSIPDVVDPYGREGLVWLADGAGEFEEAIDEAIASDREARIAHVEAFLEGQSWRRTWREMWAHVERVISTRATVHGAGLRSATSSTVTRGRATPTSVSATQQASAAQVTAKGHR